MKINIKGVIVSNDDKRVYDYFSMDSVCPNDVNSLVDKADGEPLEVHINSPGGDIFAGSEIYEALRSYEGQVNIHVIRACSAASVIACAGYSDITPTGMYMYHNVSGGSQGDYHSMDKTSEILQVANRAISAAYQQKTGKTEEEILSQMDSETWLTAQQAVDAGFIDEISKSKNVRLSALSAGEVIPQSVIYKIRNQVPNPQAEKQADFLQAKLNLLKVKVK